MLLTGTIFNTICVAVGSSLGLLVGNKASSKAQTNIVTVFGLFTIAMSILMIVDINEPIDVFIALAIGALLGESLSLHDRFSEFSAKLGEKDGGAFIKATMLFCIGGMTLVGCMNEGISGDNSLIKVKSLMDLFSSFFLALALGRGILFSAVSIFAIQGSLTLGFYFIGSGISDALKQDLTATGGVILIALAIELMGIKKFKILDIIPALALIPLVHYLHEMLKPLLASYL